MHVSREDVRIPPTPNLLKRHDFAMGENARHLGNIVTSQLKDDMDIQLKPRQFQKAVNSVCAKCRWVLPDINVASKSFYSFCCYCYVCQLWDLYSNYIEDIYVVWSKATRRIFNLPYNTNRFLLPFVVGSSHIRVNLVNRFNNFFMHWCLMTIRASGVQLPYQ